MMSKANVKYWGKAERDRSACHLLPYHCLDVAACGERLLMRQAGFRRSFSRLTGMGEEALVTWLRFFLALHDIGKFSSAFQGLRTDLMPSGCIKNAPYNPRHDSLGFLLWQEKLSESLWKRDLFGLADAGDEDEWFDLLDHWARAVTGHHGQPPKDAKFSLSRYFAPADLEAAEAFFLDVAALFLSDNPSTDYPPPGQWLGPTAEFSWWLAGFAVLADWLGSNQDFFPFCGEPMPLERYWQEIALPNADRAIEQAGLLPGMTAGRQGLSELFDGFVTPTPLQAFCERLEPGGEPELLILEDVTGAGKTEAAFLLLNRLLAVGAGQGAYLAVPTMATANAMYGRTGKVYRRLFEGETEPSLVLAHGSRQLHDGFRRSLLSESAGGDAYEKGEANAQAHCNAWIADNRKRALLAQIGVGTIDQALLAVLTSRHQSLRLLGLLGKVLVVDEVHAADDYMLGLLRRLLRIHARAGGSAILLSATLPQRMRRELAKAFREGLDAPTAELDSTDYPLVTRIRLDGVDEEKVDTRQSVKRNLRFTSLRAFEQVIDWIVAQSEAGQCIAWVRNTVGDAIEAFETLLKRLPAERLDLFHARFALSDRLAIEDRVLETFGKASTGNGRKGRVLIATQVIEQSLDLDFDQMVSDLAPIDLLIQRAGRLRRHCRSLDGDPVEGPDQRGESCLHLLAPDPNDNPDEKWYARLFPNGAYVYPNHARLWLTANLLEDKQALAIPEELRMAVEAVYSDDADADLPTELLENYWEADGEARAQASLAQANTIDFEQGYRYPGSDWWEDTHTPTRLGDRTITLRLARWDGERLRPWSEQQENAWSLSEVNIRHKLAAQEAPAASTEQAEARKNLKENWPRKGEGYLLIPLTEDNEAWTGEAINERGDTVTIRYTRRHGLTIEKTA
ncbi:CRISPR-associated helicase Cas3' [gamma proteobacterium SS-5]|uniref:CRISPR-associated helicase Cas3' n=1 Tax=Magnetovirga frankeli TaxID=947516 RepID=UPI001293C0E5